MTVVNRSDTPIRIAADGRLLAVGVIPSPVARPPLKPGRRPPKAKFFFRDRLAVCRMPADMRPASFDPDRSLILRPGERYVETIDPISVCGASTLAGELGPGAILFPTLGWPEHGHAKHKKPTHGPPPPPYVAESLHDTPGATFVRAIEGTPFSLPVAVEGDETSPKPPPPSLRDPTEVVDDFAARLTVAASLRRDASQARDVATTVSVHNTGRRGALVHIRPDDFGYGVRGPASSGDVVCDQSSSRRGAARDFFVTIAPGKSVSYTSIVSEVCPTGTFDRPGFYRITPHLTLRESGAEFRLHAMTGEVPAAGPTLLRVRSGRLPYYWSPPRALTPDQPDAAADDPAPPGTSAARPTLPARATTTPSAGTGTPNAGTGTPNAGTGTPSGAGGGTVNPNGPNASGGTGAPNGDNGATTPTPPAATAPPATVIPIPIPVPTTGTRPVVTPGTPGRFEPNGPPTPGSPTPGPGVPPALPPNASRGP